MTLPRTSIYTFSKQLGGRACLAELFTAVFFFKPMCLFPDVLHFSEISEFMPLHPSFQSPIKCSISGSIQDHREICRISRTYKQLQDSFPLLSRKSECPRKIQQEQYSLIFVSSYLRRVTWSTCSMQLHLNNNEIHQTEVLSSSRAVC